MTNGVCILKYQITWLSTKASQARIHDILELYSVIPIFPISKKAIPIFPILVEILISILIIFGCCCRSMFTYTFFRMFIGFVWTSIPSWDLNIILYTKLSTQNLALRVFCGLQHHSQRLQIHFNWMQSEHNEWVTTT